MRKETRHVLAFMFLWIFPQTSIAACTLPDGLDGRPYRPAGMASRRFLPVWLRALWAQGNCNFEALRPGGSLIRTYMHSVWALAFSPRKQSLGVQTLCIIFLMMIAAPA